MEPSPVFEDETLDWDCWIPEPPPGKSGTILVQLVYAGRDKPTLDREDEMELKATSSRTAIDADGKLWLKSEIQPSAFAQRVKCDFCGAALVAGTGEAHWHSGTLWACAKHSEEE